MTFETIKADLLIIGMGAAAQLAALYAHDANPDAEHPHRHQSAEGQGRMQSHGPRRLQRGLESEGFPRQAPHGHAQGRAVHQRPGPGQHPGRAGHAHHQGAGDQVRLLLRPQPGRHHPPEGLRRPVVRPHGPQGRPHRDRDHQPPHRAGDEAAHSRARGMPGRRTAAGSQPARRSPGRCCSTCAGASSSSPRRQRPWWPPAAAPPITAFTPPGRRNRWTAWACSTAPARSCATWRCSSSTPPG